MNWKIGQKLVCIRDDWRYYGVLMNNGPKYMEVVIYDDRKDGEFIYLLGYNFISPSGVGRIGFRSTYFRPLIGPSAKDELLSKEFVKETSDLPIQIPETV
jgi:hypothetical protein